MAPDKDACLLLHQVLPVTRQALVSIMLQSEEEI